MPNEVDPEKVLHALHYDYVPNDEMTSYLISMVVDLIAADLPGAPEHSEPHEVKEPEMDGELIDAILEPFLAQPPFVSDERDIDEGDEDEVIAFKNSIVGSSASQLGQRKLKSHATNKSMRWSFALMDLVRSMC